MLDLSKENRPLTLVEMKKLVSACGGNAKSRKYIRRAHGLPGDAFDEFMYPMTLPEGVSLEDLIRKMGFRDSDIEEYYLKTRISREMCGDWQVSYLTPDHQKKLYPKGVNSLEDLATYCRSKGWEVALPIHLVGFLAYCKPSGSFLVPTTEIASGKQTVLSGTYGEIIQGDPEYLKNWIKWPAYNFLCVRRPQ